MSELAYIHNKIEQLWRNSVDHSYADYLHRFVDEQNAELIRLREQLAKVREVIKPFTWPVFHELLGGNIQGDSSVVFARNKGQLLIGDFRRAYEWYKATEADDDDYFETNI